MIKVIDIKENRLRQGDIIQDVECIESVKEEENVVEIRKIIFPYIIVLTQDCDLKLEFKLRLHEEENQDKWLISALVAPLYIATHVYDGEHLADIGIKSRRISKKKEKNFLENNQIPRYHYLKFEEDKNTNDLVIDFKHYFSIQIDYLEKLKETNFLFSIAELFREEISRRFACFLSRIGLPEFND